MKVLDITKLRELAGLPVTEAMISGDWERLGIDHANLEIDDDFPGKNIYTYMEYPNVWFFADQNTGSHFATAFSVESDGSTQIKDRNDKVVAQIPSGGLSEINATVEKMWNTAANAWSAANDD